MAHDRAAQRLTPEAIGSRSEDGIVRWGGQEIPYQVVRSARRKKTLQLTVDSMSGAMVRAPVEAPLREIDAFVQKRAAWIAERVAEAQPAERPVFDSGLELTYLGRQVELSVAESDRQRRATVHLLDGVLAVTVPAGLAGDERQSAIQTAVLRWYRNQAEARLRESVARWAAAVGHAPTAVLVRNQKRRWGSCAADGRLRFNWRAVMLEPQLLDYIVVHELAHLAVRNHSPAFWSLVRTAMPDAEERRPRLREAGKELPL